MLTLQRSLSARTHILRNPCGAKSLCCLSCCRSVHHSFSPSCFQHCGLSSERAVSQSSKRGQCGTRCHLLGEKCRRREKLWTMKKWQCNVLGDEMNKQSRRENYILISCQVIGFLSFSVHHSIKSCNTVYCSLKEIVIAFHFCPFFFF